MFQSHVIEVAGVFAGAAVNEAGIYRFVAVDPRFEELDGSEWPSLPDIRRVVGRHLVSNGHLPGTGPGAHLAPSRTEISPAGVP
jgi:hypothetical protein